MANVTFDGANHLIIVGSGIEELDAQIEIYSDWKEWVASGDNIKYYPAFDTPDGGRDLSPSLRNGDYYFLNNQDVPALYPASGIRDGWRIRPDEVDHELVINGNLYVTDVTKPFVVPTLGNYTVIVRLETSSLTQTVVSGSGVTEQDKTDIIEGVWSEPGRGLETPEDYKADVSGLATSSALSIHDTDIKTLLNNLDFTTLEDLIKQLREKNISYRFTEATVQNLTRNVGIGVVDYIEIKIKQDTDSDWNSPVDTSNLYFWYENMNDTNPIYVGEET
jgi:hypothetical protein